MLRFDEGADNSPGSLAFELRYVLKLIQKMCNYLNIITQTLNELTNRYHLTDEDSENIERLIDDREKTNSFIELRGPVVAWIQRRMLGFGAGVIDTLTKE